MDNRSKPEGGATKSSPLIRLLRAKILNVIVILVIIVCIILFMREQDPDETLQMIPVKDTDQPGVHIVEDGAQPPAPPAEMDSATTTQFIVQDVQRKSGEDRHKELTTTRNDMTTTPFYTTVPPKVHLKQDSEKETIHIDYLKVNGYEVGQLKLDFLSNYRNPCFFEEREVVTHVHVGSTYRYNPYINREQFTEKFHNLKKMVIHSHEELCGSSAGCRLRCIPYFMVIGTGESETIEFFDTLTLHKQIIPPLRQQLEFWHKYRFIDANFNDYLDLFDNVSTSIHQHNYTDINTHEHLYLSVTGEAAPISMLTDPYWRKNQMNEDLAEPQYLLAHELHHVMPNLKFIFLLREPVAHIYWHYNNAPYGRDQKSPDDFHRRVKNSLDWWSLCTVDKGNPNRACVYGSPPDMDEFENRDDDSWWSKTSDFLGALRDGLYWFYINDYLAVYSRENFLFVRSDDYLADKTKVLNEKVFPFLDVSPFRDSPQALDNTVQQPNGTPEFKPMLAETHTLLTNFYQPYNEKLAQLLQDDGFLWKDITSSAYKPNN